MAKKDFSVQIPKHLVNKAESVCEVVIPGESEKYVFNEFIVVGFPEETSEGTPLNLLGAVDFSQQVAAMEAILEVVVSTLNSMDPIQKVMTSMDVQMRIVECLRGLKTNG